MAGKTKSKKGKTRMDRGTGNRGTQKGPQSSDARKFKSIENIQEIMPLDFSSSEQGSPRNSWADIVEATEKGSNKSKGSWSKIVGDVPAMDGVDLSSGETQSTNVKITMEDISDEVEYWRSAVICYVLGSNPPQNVMEGFIKRIWGSHGIDKIAQVEAALFLIRLFSLTLLTSDESYVQKRMEILLDLLTLPNDEVRQQAISLLGASASDSTGRDLFHEYDSVSKFIAMLDDASLLSDPTKLPLLREVTSTLLMFCKGQSQPADAVDIILTIPMSRDTSINQLDLP